MKTQDLFKTKAAKVNESIHKTFGKKIDFSTFDAPKLEDARNKLRTQLSQVRNTSGFNENLENDAYHEAQWMLDAINKELAEREEAAVDSLEIDESPVETEANGEEMEKVTEGEVQQASAIVTAKTMTDKVGRFIEELSGMESDTLLQLGDSIRDEMGEQESKSYIEAAAPAIEQAIATLKTTRESLASAVRTLTGEQSDAGMLGAEPQEGGETDMAEPAPEAGAEAPADDFATAEPAAGGMEAAGREKRESIDYGSRLLNTLAG
jgi:hypothetical protein